MTTRILSAVVALCLCAGARGAGGRYQTARPEVYRPQFHFTSQRNWLNDPNGLVYYKGIYHLFFQHNPRGNRWGNMTWGHAVSPDLIHWTQLDHALLPDKNGVCFSGSGVVDHANTSGFQAGAEKPIVLIYSSMARGGSQSLGFSTDGGKTWQKHPGNPVLPNIAKGNRDPKVIWHEPTRKWIMSLYISKRVGISFYSSPNLKTWTLLSSVGGFFECPDMFELPVDGNPNKTRWVIFGADAKYLIGHFDGKAYRKESGKHTGNWGGNFYAAQTWSDIPKGDGRRIIIGWMRGGKYPGMPFNQQMSFPCELTLRTTPEGIRMYAKPVKEIENIHAKEHTWKNLALRPGVNPLAGITGDLFDIRAQIAPAGASEFGFNIRGHKVVYSVGQRKVTALGRSAGLSPERGVIGLQILVDRSSIEVFGNDGRISMATCFLPDPDDRTLGIFATGGAVKVLSLKVHELFSCWEKWPQPGRPRKKKPAKAKKKKIAPPPTVSPGERKAERLFKMARQAEAMGQRSAAASLYSKIVKDHSKSPFAERARKRLDSLGK